MATLNIKVISDSTCPFCYIGKARLDRAIAAFSKTNPAATTKISWHAYSLNPNPPSKSVPVTELLAQKFGPDRLDAVKAYIRPIGAKEGINLTHKGRTGNVRDSHRLIQLAKEKGKEHETVGEIMRMYHEEGGDITKHEDLISAAEKAGLDAEETRVWLNGTKGGDVVDKEVAEAYKMGISGVPHFVVNDKYEIHGAQELEAFIDTFNKAAGA